MRVFPLAAGLAVAACNSTPAGSQTAAKLVPRIVSAAESARSAHLVGSAASGSQTVLMDMSFGGTSVAGTVGVSRESLGQHVLQIRQGGYTLDVAAHGSPFPEAFTGSHGENLEFSDWNSVTLPAPPAASQLITFPNLG